MKKSKLISLHFGSIILVIILFLKNNLSDDFNVMEFTVYFLLGVLITSLLYIVKK